MSLQGAQRASGGPRGHLLHPLQRASHPLSCPSLWCSCGVGSVGSSEETVLRRAQGLKGTVTHLSRETSLVEPSGSPGAWEKVLAPNSLCHLRGGFPGDAQDCGLAGGAGVCRSPTGGCEPPLRIEDPGEPPGTWSQKEAKRSCACVCVVQRKLVICLI